MRKYLHAPIVKTDTIMEYIANKQPEGEQLDFKAKPWTNNLELCKDVAAFANHLGGDIVIGIEDKGDCANGFCPIVETDISTIIKTIQQGLLNHLRPQTISQSIEYRAIASTHPGQFILVISIPPSIDLVATEERVSDIFNYRFPIRNARRNQFLTYEEIMTRVSTTSRITYIRLNDLATDNIKIKFSNPLWFELRGTLFSPIAPNFHGTLISYNRDVFTILMEAFTKSREIDKGIKTSPSLSHHCTPPNLLLTIPLELIKAIWKNTNNEILNIALDAKIILYGKTWTIIYD